MKRKSEKIIDALGSIDDRYVMECLPLLFVRPRHRRRNWLLAAACLALCIFAVPKVWPAISSYLLQSSTSVQPSEPGGPLQENADQADQEDPMIPQELPKLTLGTVDLSKEVTPLLAYSAEELLTGNPVDLEALPETMPVYRTADTAADWDAMEQALWAAADFLGVTGETARTEEGLELQNYEEAYIFVDQNLSMEIDLYADALRALPEGCGSDSLETAQAAADYLLKTYGAQLGMTQPTAAVAGGYYRLSPNVQRYDVVIYDAAGDTAEQLLQFSLSQITFHLDAAGVYAVEINRHALGEKCGDYPILTPQEAEALLLQGYGVTAVPETAQAESPELAAAELVYLAPDGAAFYIPYYRFLALLPESGQGSAQNEYGAYYVPAVHPAYISDNRFWKTQEAEQDDPANLPDLPKLALGTDYVGNGGGTLLAMDAAELLVGSPIDAENVPETLPVYRNLYPTNEVQDPEGWTPDEEAMEAALLEIAEQFGVDGEIVLYTIPYYDLSIGDDTWQIDVTGDLSVTVVPLVQVKNMQLPEGCGSDTLEAAEAAAAYLKEQFGETLGFAQPEAMAIGGDYSNLGEQCYQVVLYDGSGSPEEQMRNRWFHSASFYLYQDEVSFIEIQCAGPGEALGDYPVLSLEEAEALLRQGYGMTACPERPEELEIAKADLIYLDMTWFETYVPVYRFLVKMPGEHESGCNIYSVFYLPAVRPSYISDNRFWKTPDVEQTFEEKIWSAPDPDKIGSAAKEAFLTYFQENPEVMEAYGRYDLEFSEGGDVAVMKCSGPPPAEDSQSFEYDYSSGVVTPGASR